MFMSLYLVIIYTIVKDENIEYDDFIIKFGEFIMPADKEWQDRVKGILKAELKRRNISYRDLAERLEGVGIHETERNIANKIARGGFSAVFFIQCLIAIGCKELVL